MIGILCILSGVFHTLKVQVAAYVLKLVNMKATSSCIHPFQHTQKHVWIPKSIKVEPIANNIL